MRCPWCERYIELAKKEEDVDYWQEILSKGFWASIREVHEELYSLNKILTPHEALEEGYPIQINMRTGEVTYGRLVCSLAEKRDEFLNRELEHFWILSKSCSMSFMIPICEDLANVTSDVEALEFELEEEVFSDIKTLTKGLLEKCLKEYDEQ